MTLTVILILTGIAFYVLWLFNRHNQALLREIRELREDNRALTEALVRVEGKPLIFGKHEKRDAEGYFDKVQIDGPTQ